MGIRKGCVPRRDLLSGRINLGDFTASLGEVHDSYRAGAGASRTVYTDARTFFSEGTYATDNMKLVVRDVFARLDGDTTAPLLKRLETGFGGGKTHTMIACLHIAKRGREIAAEVGELLPEDALPEPGEISVVAVAGEQLPVRVHSGADLRPYPLWAEVARQIGGSELEADVSDYLHRLDSPDEGYFKKVFGGRRTLILIDELAHYAARWAVAHPDAREMPGAFFMSLFEHARKNPGIAIVVSLASVQDAFSAETSGLARMLTEASGKEMGGEDAIIKQESAMSVISTVLARDETVVIPVQAKDLSSVLAKRLFESIDPAEARRSAEEYRELYRRNASLLPPGFRLDDYVEEMASSYPFHPTLVELLNKKLSTVPTFQRTRGVLRILALAVRSLWLKERDPSAIHACHLDFMDSRTVDELFGRTDNSALLSVVNADVGTADTSLLKAGRSNAEIADDENRHPLGVPYHVDTWKTVLLHSLAGQSQRLSSTVFGIAETDAILATARPELTPSQVQEALKSISEKAYYLHFGSGRYYADTLPSINVPLSSIRKSLTEEQLCTELEAKLRKVVTEDRRGFSVVADVVEPQHIPDAPGRPVLALLSPRLKTADPAVFITRRQHDQPRIQQNRVFLLVPEIVSIKRPSDDRTLFDVRAPEAEVVLQEIYDLVRSVLAMKRLQDSPNDYAITHEQLRAHDFRARLAEREKALETRVSRLCKYLVYPSEDPVFSVAEIRTAGGEGGEAMRTQIRTALQNVGKLLSEDNINRATLSGLRDLLFEASDRITVGDAQKRFYERRGWPALESLELLPRIVSEGVRQGLWCAAVGFDDQEARPDRFFDAGNQVPLNEIPDPDWLLVTPEGARKRGWGSEPRLTQRDYRDLVDGLLQKRPSARFDEALSEVGRVNPDADPDQVKEAMIDLARHGRVHIFEGDPDQTERPDRLVSGAAAVSVGALDNIVVISDEEAGRRGWKGHDDRRIVLGKDDLDTILALTRRLGPLYARGATTVIDRFELYEFELPGGTRMSVELGMIGPDSIRHMAEMLEIMSDKLVPTSESDARLEIDDPDDECPLVREIAERRRH